MLGARTQEVELPARFNPFDPSFVRNPYPTYAELRREAAVARVRIGMRQMFRMLVGLISMQRRQGGLRLGAGLKFLYRRATARGSRPRAASRPGLRSRIYTVSRYAEVSQVLRTPGIFSSEIMGGSQAESMNAEGDIAPTAGSIIGQDPPEHVRQRGIVNRGFTPRRVAALEPRIRKNAEELFASFEGKGSCDLMTEFADPLPVSVIADLLGLDPNRRDDFKRWSSALIVGSTQPGGEGFGARIELFREFRAYMTDVIDERRQTPGLDLISTLIHSGEGEGILDPEQVISFASLLLAAGSETTSNLIGNAVLALLANPEQLERVQHDPRLVGNLVEETLRYDPPIQLVMRATTRATELCGVEIPKHALVLPLLGAANRDPAVFAEPDRFDITRDNQAHLGFGLGNHFCLGASLARLEAAIALETIFERLPDWRIDAERTPRHGSWLVRGPTALPLRF